MSDVVPFPNGGDGLPRLDATEERDDREIDRALRITADAVAGILALIEGNEGCGIPNQDVEAIKALAGIADFNAKWARKELGGGLSGAGTK